MSPMGFVGDPDADPLRMNPRRDPGSMRGDRDPFGGSPGLGGGIPSMLVGPDSDMFQPPSGFDPEFGQSGPGFGAPPMAFGPPGVPRGGVGPRGIDGPGGRGRGRGTGMGGSIFGTDFNKPPRRFGGAGAGGFGGGFA